MSRIGKKPIIVPDGVEVTISTQNTVTIKGTKGMLSQQIPKDFQVEYNKTEKKITVRPANEIYASNLWGLYKVLIDNMVTGVSAGYRKVLEIQGIGYKAEMKGKSLVVSAGYSHPIMYIPSDGISVATESPTKVVVSGIDKQKVGQTAAEIRGIRPPEPYKGKGIRYEGEHIVRKAGKAGA